MMGFVEAVKKCFANYANFNGRARRSEFWWFYLLQAIPGLIMSCLVQWKMGVAAEIEAKAFEAVINGNSDELVAQASTVDSVFGPAMIVLGIISLALLIPSLAVWARRLHDVGKSGWFILLIFACGIGGLIPLIMCIADGKPEPNQYGESPKYKPQVV